MPRGSHLTPPNGPRDDLGQDLCLAEMSLAPYTGAMGNAFSNSERGDGKKHTMSSTQWSVVLAAASSQTEVSRGALEQLCAKYWRPLYYYVRRRGYGVEQAQDCTQAFFADLLDRKALKRVEQGRGRFRSFLLACLKNFLSDEWDKARAQKRGGGLSALPLDFALVERSAPPQAVNHLTPEKLYERQWALSVLDEALGRVEREYVDAGKQELFAAMAPVLSDSGLNTPYLEVAGAHGLSEGAFKVAVHRLRKRYRNHVRAVIRETVTEGDDIEDELQELLRAVSTDL